MNKFTGNIQNVLKIMIISKTSEPQNLIMSKETKTPELEFGKNMTCHYGKHYLKTNLNQQWWGHIT